MRRLLTSLALLAITVPAQAAFFGPFEVGQIEV